ncbi:SPO22-domain-containing protein [Hortaea werneckii]|nr:SPO22-domain-containing protein [Hortaea werneckii]KAI7094530.1 SPO22-domain-containing protein [Hortaea werneckii]KAI7226097.1 SPO22-domain-containing protein [Hortaea werneckii]KAI7329836.1 SPO22-domain-containing protein [Hortaea werneckii]KAI7378363.1 SPO22-domain-containing protein [Hortaea werneckii]
MAQLDGIKRNAGNKRVKHILELAETAHRLLNDRITPSKSFEDELEETIKRAFPLPTSTPLAGKAEALDLLGSQLWNAATNFLREEEIQQDAGMKSHDTSTLVVRLRVFAFLLIDTASHASAHREKSQASGQLELASKVFERCSEYVGKPEPDDQIVYLTQIAEKNESDDQRVFDRLKYVADHFFSKVGPDALTLSSDLAENAADSLHEAAKSAADIKNTDLSIKWCERAVAALNNCEQEDLSLYAAELRLAIASTMIDALLSQSMNAGSRLTATKIIEDLETSHGISNRVALALLRLRLLVKSIPVDVEQLNLGLERVIRLTIVTERGFKTIMQAIHQAKRHNTMCALTALKYLATDRLVADTADFSETNAMTIDRIERTVVTYSLFATTSNDIDAAEAIDCFHDLLEVLYRHMKAPLSAKATHAAQTLIWKNADRHGSQAAENWLKLLQHPMFDSAGLLNKAKIWRKAIISALARTDVTAARETYYSMPPACQNEDMSRYLAFKIALRSGDNELADESLHALSKHADKDPSCFYACILEAEQARSRHLAVLGLQRLLDKQLHGTHLPSLLRCTARLMMKELESAESRTNEVAEKIVNLFERARDNIKVLRQGTEDQWRVEIQWWSKNAYNLALKLCETIHPELLVRLLTVCVRFLDCYPNDGGAMHAEDVLRRKSSCHFLSACGLIVLARSANDDHEYGRRMYLQARQEIASFRADVAKIEKTRMGDASTDKESTTRSSRLFQLLKFDLEAILHLQQWQQLNQAFSTFLNFPEGGDNWDSLADLILIIHQQAPSIELGPHATSRIPQLLQRCINETWKKDRDIVKMSRWLRLAFSMHLHDQDNGLALKLVEQAAAIARKGYNSEGEEYPNVELTWLATMAFNKAIDCFASGDYGGCQSWADAALELAYYADDNGSLHAHLTEKRKLAESRMGKQRE